jgi:hypothetical protein
MTVTITRLLQRTIFTIFVASTRRNPMQGNLQPASVTLPEGGVFTLSGATTAAIRCEAGTLWLTQNNDSRDIVLQPGEQFRPDRPGKVLVFALNAGSLTWSFAQHADASPSNRLIAWLKGNSLVRRVAGSFNSRHPAFE